MCEIAAHESGNTSSYHGSLLHSTRLEGILVAPYFWLIVVAPAISKIRQPNLILWQNPANRYSQRLFRVPRLDMGPIETFREVVGTHVRQNVRFSFFRAIRKSCDRHRSTSFSRVRGLQGRQSTILDPVMVLKNNESQKGSPHHGGCRLLGEKQTGTCFIFAVLAALIWCLIGGSMHAHDDFMADSVNAAEGSMALVHVLMYDG